MKRIIGALVVLVIVSFTVQSFMTVDDSFYQSRKQYWDTAREITIAVAEAMPEEKYSYSPGDSVRTFAAQMYHISSSSIFIYSKFISEEEMKGGGMKEEDMKKADHIAALNKMFDHIEAGMKKISKKDLMKEVKVFNGKLMTKAELFHFLQDHLTNHRAKANLYIRLNKIKPPSYGY